MAIEVNRRYLPFQSEADLQRHLPVGNASVFDVTAHFRNFEPAHIAHCFLRSGERVFYGVFDSLW